MKQNINIKFFASDFKMNTRLPKYMLRPFSDPTFSSIFVKRYNVVR
jgi:hypothetical protein